MSKQRQSARGRARNAGLLTDDYRPGAGAQAWADRHSVIATCFWCPGCDELVVWVGKGFVVRRSEQWAYCASGHRLTFCHIAATYKWHMPDRPLTYQHLVQMAANKFAADYPSLMPSGAGPMESVPITHVLTRNKTIKEKR